MGNGVRSSITLTQEVDEEEGEKNTKESSENLFLKKDE
jgi:hypothetical protein